MRLQNRRFSVALQPVDILTDGAPKWRAIGSLPHNPQQ
jgi:hypothetical protein